MEIADEDRLYRRLAPNHLNPDGSVNSNAFKLNGKPDPQISVDIARLTSPEQSVARSRNSNCRLSMLIVGEVRSLGLGVLHRPTDENYAHGVILGNATKATCRQLAERAVVLAVAAPGET